MDRFDPFVKYSDIYGDVINWEKDPMNKPQNQNKYFFSDGKTYYEQICKMLRLMSVFKDAFNQIYDNEDEISSAWENFVDNLSATAVSGEEAGVELTWTDTSVNFAFTFPRGEAGVGISSITFNSDYTMTITLTDGQTYTSASLRGPQGPQGQTGPQGPEGPQGPAGQGLQILDTYATLSDLQTAHPTGQPGDAYQVGTAPSFTLYIWSSSQSQWVPAGTLSSVSPSLTNPLMDGTASAGSSDLYSRGDHVHPSDTSRASVTDLNNLSDIINESESLLNQEFTYRQSPAEYDGLVNIDKIKGNTIVWNQLNDPVTNSGVFTFSNGTYTGTGTATGNLTLTGNIPHQSGHKYLCYLKTIANPNNVGFTIGANSGNPWITSAGTVGNHSTIYTNTNPTTIRWFDVTNKDLTGIKFNLYIIDLTLMFGAGNEPTTLSDFTDLFQLPYYNYNVGSLLSFNGTGLKTENASQTENNTLSLPVSTYFPTGMKSAGSVYDELTPTKAITRIGSVDLGTLDWEYRGNVRANLFSVAFNNQYAHKLDAGALCERYKYDGTVDGVVEMANKPDKVICLYYSENNNSGNIYIVDTNYTDPTAFKTAMSGVYLFFELLTSTEQDIDIDLTCIVWNSGTEQLLPINTATPTTSPIICDMSYMGINDEILYLYNNSGASEDIEELRNDISNIETQIGSESTTPMTGILGRVNTLESNVSGLGSDITDLETEIGSDSTTPMTGLAGRIKTIENVLNNLKGKVVFEYTSTSNSQGLTTSQLDLSDLNNATHIEVIYSVYKNGNDTLSTGIIPLKFYDPSSIAINGTVSEHQIDQDRGRPWGINSSGLLTISSCTTYYPDSSETSNDYLIIRQVILYKFTRASSLI